MMKNKGCQRSAREHNLLVAPKDPLSRQKTPISKHISDPYLARLAEQRTKLFADQTHIHPPAIHTQKLYKTLIMTAQDIHHDVTALHTFGSPPDGWIPKDKIMSMVRQIDRAKQAKNMRTANAHI